MRPEFSICKPFNAFGQSSISPTRKYLSKCRTIWIRDAIIYNLSCPSEICTTDCYRGVVSLVDEFNICSEVARTFGGSVDYSDAPTQSEEFSADNIPGPSSAH